MNYDDLRRYQRMEKTDPKMAELPDNYEQQLAQLITENKDAYGKAGGTADLKTLENILKIARDIYDRREQKMVMKALADARTGAHEPKSLLGGEHDAYVQLKQALKGKRADFDEVLAGRAPKRMEKSDASMLDEKLGAEMAPKAAESTEGLNTVLVKTIKNLPKFVSSELGEYGPYEEGKVVSMPRKEADMLSKGGFIELI